MKWLGTCMCIRTFFLTHVTRRKKAKTSLFGRAGCGLHNSAFMKVFIRYTLSISAPKKASVFKILRNCDWSIQTALLIAPAGWTVSRAIRTYSLGWASLFFCYNAIVIFSILQYMGRLLATERVSELVLSATTSYMICSELLQVDKLEGHNTE